MQESYFYGVTPEGFHKIYYREYGKKGLPVLVAVHGLTRNAYDFHFLAEALQDSYHVFSIDMIGRGKSDYLPPQYYNYPPSTLWI
jgi:pimeloyl-ACP methyl ester carboxylesterase